MTPDSPHHSLPPALVLGSGITALGVVRTLGRQGIEARVAMDAHWLVQHSRWCGAAPDLPEHLTGETLAEYLQPLAIERAVLMPCTDETAAAATALPRELSERFPSFLPATEPLHVLVDKGAFLEVLLQNDVPHPRTHLLSSPKDLEALSEGELAHAFIKPRDSQSFFRRYGVKALRPGPADDLRDLMSGPLGEGFRLMVQEYVPGPPSNHYFIDGFADEHGTILAHLARQRLRMFPVDFGNSTSMVTVDPTETEEAVRSLGILLEAISFRGIFSAEFKRDARDGTFRILEVNARPWWYVEFAARAGLDVLRMAYDAALGRPVSVPGPYRVGVRLVHPYYEFHALQSQERSSWRAWRKLLPLIPGAQQPILALDDPWPLVREALPGALRFAARPYRLLTGRK